MVRALAGVLSTVTYAAVYIAAGGRQYEAAATRSGGERQTTGLAV